MTRSVRVNFWLLVIILGNLILDFKSLACINIRVFRGAFAIIVPLLLCSSWDSFFSWKQFVYIRGNAIKEIPFRKISHGLKINCIKWCHYLSFANLTSIILLYLFLKNIQLDSLSQLTATYFTLRFVFHFLVEFN
jgi:hypothetical protein